MGTIYSIALTVALGSNPGAPEMVYSSPESVPMVQENCPMPAAPMAVQPAPYAEASGGIFGDELYPYDAQYPWLHGYFQEMPAYGGYKSFRPYNYKHVLSQTQAAGGWGLSPQMGYSQQFWHRYQYRASMEHELSSNKALEKAEYLKEIARLKARLDFERAKSLSQQQSQTGIRQASSELEVPANDSLRKAFQPQTTQGPVIRPGAPQRR